MAFLDNSGDIILDAVLTDEGRRRLAAGDGSFRISKFAFGDDEIDYTLYNKNHASGSAYYDLEILQTPIFEAFTNNASSMKSKALSINNPNLLYLPIIKLNESTRFQRIQSGFGQNTFIVVVNKSSQTSLANVATGILFGAADSDDNNVQGEAIRLDQGLDTTSISYEIPLSSNLTERSFTIQLDSRLGKLYDRTGATETKEFSIDDDGMATYLVTVNDSGYVNEITDRDQASGVGDSVLAGPRGNKLEFKIRATDDLGTSNYYFDLFGTTDASATIAGTSLSSAAVKYIDSIVSVYGSDTGYSVQIPIRYLKVTS